MLLMRDRVVNELEHRGEEIGLWLRIMKAAISDSKTLMSLLQTDLYEMCNQKHPTL